MYKPEVTTKFKIVKKFFDWMFYRFTFPHFWDQYWHLWPILKLMEEFGKRAKRVLIYCYEDDKRKGRSIKYGIKCRLEGIPNNCTN